MRNGINQAKQKIKFGGLIVDKSELMNIAAEERKIYFREWRAANKEKTAEHRRRYWEKKALERINAMRSEEKTDGAEYDR